MLSERDIELAHPDAFDFVWGNLPAARRADFNHHLGVCRYCQAIVDEYSEIGQVIKNLPPHVEPSADLEERTIAAMVAALAELRATADRRPDAEDQAATKVYPVPQRQPPAEDKTWIHPAPANQPPPAEPQTRATVTRLPVWRRYPRRLAAAVAVAAAIIAAAIVIPLSLGRGGLAEAVTFKLMPPPGSAQTASGTAVARQDTSGSWDITLTVRHLKSFGDTPWYQCWYVGTDRAGDRQVASAGTFLVPNSGNGTFSMTSAVDPRQFKTMEIRLESPNANGAIQGPVVLSGTAEL
jgi:hypothetical protein